MKNVVMLDTAVGSLNQGDEIINYSIKNNWKEIFEDNYIMRLATHTPMFTPLQAFIYKNKLSVFKDADYKFLCGTNALYTNMFRPLPAWNINIFNAGLAKNTICLGVGIGVNSKRVNLYTKALYKKVLSKDYIHSTRDEKTKIFLERLGFRAENTGCPTLWGLTPDHCRLISDKKSDNVVFTLTSYEADIKNDKSLIEILERNYKNIYFWPQSISDLDYLRFIYEGNSINVISPNLEAYKEILSTDIDYIGNRLHGGIFAMQNKSRAIILAIDYRAREMSKNYSLICIERAETGTKLEKLINSEWKTEVKGLDFEKIKNWKRQFI